MPWHKKTMKDVAACDKPWWGGKQPLNQGFPNGETYPVEDGVPASWTHRLARGQPGELKHLSSRRKRKKIPHLREYSLSSGERKGNSLNRLNCVFRFTSVMTFTEGPRAICLVGVARSLHSLPGIREVEHTKFNFPSRSELESSAREGDSPVMRKG